jgi:hypothetical protein
MNLKLLPAHNGKHVTKITTTSGVVGVFASDVPAGAIEVMLARALKRQKEMSQTAVRLARSQDK